MSWDVMEPACAPFTRAASLRGNCHTLTRLLMQSGENSRNSEQTTPLTTPHAGQVCVQLLLPADIHRMLLQPVLKRSSM